MRYALAYLTFGFIFGRFVWWVASIVKVDATPQGWRIHL